MGLGHFIASRLKNGQNYGWVICASVSIMQLTVVVFITTVASLFALPMSSALGVTRSAWMLWMTFFAIAYTLASPLWGSLMQNTRIPLRPLITFAVLLEVIALLLFAFCTELWMAYLGGVLFGVSQVGTRTNLMPNMASMWFTKKRRGTALAIMNCSSGIGGMIFPPILQIVISDYGCTYAYCLCAILVCIFCLPFTMFILERQPADLGLKPVGYSKEDEEAELYEKASAENVPGKSFRFALKTWPFYVLSLATFLLAITGGFKNSLTGVAVEFLSGTQWAEEAAIISAFCLSVISFSDLVSNLIIGPLIDKFGVYRPMIAFLLMEPAIYICWIFWGNSPYGLVAGALFYGLHGCVLRNAIPLEVHDLYGPKNFSRIFSVVYMWKGLMGGFAASIYAAFYDYSGSYIYGIYFGLVTIVLAAILHFFVIYVARRDVYEWKKEHAEKQIEQ